MPSSLRNRLSGDAHRPAKSGMIADPFDCLVSNAVDGPASRRKLVFGIVSLGASRWPPQIVIRYPSGATRPNTIVDIDQLLTDATSQPLSDSIGPVATVLADRTLIVPTSGPVLPPPTPVPLQVGADVHGRLWVYAYTDLVHFQKVFPAESHHATIKFLALFRIVDADTNLAGILLNSGSTAYPIMRTLFSAVRRVTRQSADG